MSTPKEFPETLSIAASATATGVAPVSAKGSSPELTLPARYEDLGRIAGGASGDVRRVRDRVLDRVLALKVLRWDHVDNAAMRRRFLAEARCTADLQHPGIVAVHDQGEFEDGRLWFTMKEVRGRTLGAVIAEVHAGSSPSGWTFRRLVDSFARIAQAVAYAHSRGVVHRDLKPENLMVGEFGEALVMDWGLSLRIADGPASDPDAPSPPPAPMANVKDAPVTRHGDVLGTPAYMPPEQARGRRDLHGPESDVYALGAILYHVLAGRPPYAGESGLAVWRQVLAGPPPPVTEVARGEPPIPDALAAICARAMQREIADRYPNADVLAREVLGWLDGAERREQALAALEEASTRAPEIAAKRARAAEAQGSAKAILGALRPFDPIEVKRPGWALEDEAARLGREAALLETDWLTRVHGALTIAPDLPEAHALLADHYREMLLGAERARREEDAARFEALLRVHDRGRYAAFLRGDGELWLETDPAGARVTAYRYEPRDRRLALERFADLGEAPIRGARLPRGSYGVLIQAGERAEVRVPVLLGRDERWDAGVPIALPREGELGPDDCYVPAGECWIGGDPEAIDSLRGQKVWVDGFVIRRFPVTNREYVAFLNDLVARGREGEAVSACPRAQLGLADSAEDRPVFGRDREGKFALGSDGAGPPWHPDWPVVLVDWHGASAYARWLAETTGQPWRLPNEIEREKAARGVDGRIYPWGDHPDATFACVAESHAGEPSREPVTGRPLDESPYGVRGLGGNVRDWCINVWKPDGPPIEGGRLLLDAADPVDPEFRIIKGGMWGSPIANSRAAARFGGRPGLRRLSIGARVVRSVQVPVRV